MDMEQQPLTQRMMRSFFRFRKNAWHEFSISGLKPSEVRVLFGIKRGATPDHEYIKVSEISKFLNVTSPTVTQLVNSLEEKGLVERHFDPSDRRVVNIGLTEQGKHVTLQASEAFAASTNGLIQYLGEDQSQQLVALLEQVNQYFQEKRMNALSDSSPWG